MYRIAPANAPKSRAPARAGACCGVPVVSAVWALRVPNDSPHGGARGGRVFGIGSAFSRVDLSVSHPAPSTATPKATGFGAKHLSASLEKSHRTLLSLRLAYLDALSAAKASTPVQVLLLVRIAELHLDFAARIRRLGYPPGATQKQQAQFDKELSRRASPLEAAGLGVLEQAAHLCKKERLGGRFLYPRRRVPGACGG